MYGVVGVGQFSIECLNDPKTVALRHMVRASADDALKKDEARVIIKLRDGRTCTKHVQHARGSIERPLSDAKLVLLDTLGVILAEAEQPALMITRASKRSFDWRNT